MLPNGMEAYDMLAAEKHCGESFNRVIKRKFRRASTASALLERLDDLCLSESTLENLDKIKRARAQSPTKSPIPG